MKTDTNIWINQITNSSSTKNKNLSLTISKILEENEEKSEIRRKDCGTVFKKREQIFILKKRKEKKRICI